MLVEKSVGLIKFLGLPASSYKWIKNSLDHVATSGLKTAAHLVVV